VVLDKNEFSRRFTDGKQAVMLYLTAGQSPDQFDFNEDRLLADASQGI
jgi:hypothetical protein